MGLKETYIGESELGTLFKHLCSNNWFQWFAGRSVIDFKLDGTRNFQLQPPYDVVNPILCVMIALAERTLRPGEELALIQVIMNRFKDGGNSVKPHMHRCRQICLSLGAPRDCEVEDRVMTLKHADVLHLANEIHGVPASNVKGTRISICLFYGSTEEYANRSISVNATDGWFGDEIWWTHPSELHAAHGPRRG